MAARNDRLRRRRRAVDTLEIITIIATVSVHRSSWRRWRRVRHYEALTAAAAAMMPDTLAAMLFISADKYCDPKVNLSLPDLLSYQICQSWVSKVRSLLFRGSGPLRHIAVSATMQLHCSRDVALPDACARCTGFSHKTLILAI